MTKKMNLGLIPKIIAAIILGVLIGKFTPEAVVRIFVTFGSIFGNFLGFIIPLIIIGFVAAGIAELGSGAGKLLGITVFIAYGFTLISGFFGFSVGKMLLPSIVENSSLTNISSQAKDLAPYFTVKIPAMMEVTTALIFAFLLGLGISATQSKTLKSIADEFQNIISKTIAKIIIPLLPLYILGIFANMTFTGKATTVFSVFWKVFIIIIACHFIMISLQFTLGCILNKKNVFKCLKIQVKGYLTALGTQSSAATIPVNLECSEKIGITKGIREFVIPLGATIHMSGSTITITMCAMAVTMLNNKPVDLASFSGFIAMLGVSLVAAPGVPGGCVMAALGVLKSILGFSEPMLGLMIALYIAQDSFGTACNISGDQAVAMIVDKISKGMKKEEKSEEKLSA
ncbi:dicarboxylate/amino acid:cation symporter [Clostridium oceanicum]|uniref:Dicarboxylate/amino acid:cation symporter n=1 Tax=Clostridium oceanicum TaxID=1543 RepID=A0ABN1JNX3_9CLOT